MMGGGRKVEIEAFRMTVDRAHGVQRFQFHSAVRSPLDVAALLFIGPVPATALPLFMVNLVRAVEDAAYDCCRGKPLWGRPRCSGWEGSMMNGELGNSRIARGYS